MEESEHKVGDLHRTGVMRREGRRTRGRTLYSLPSPETISVQHRLKVTGVPCLRPFIVSAASAELEQGRACLMRSGGVLRVPGE